MNESRECVKEGRIRSFWMSQDDCRRLCQLMEDMPEPDGCHVKIELGDPMFPDLLLRCVGHCDTPNSSPDRTCAQRDGGLPEMMFDPYLRRFWGDPRWDEILKKAGLYEAWLKHREV